MERNGDMFVGLTAGVLGLVLVVGITWFSASQEAQAFNRCNPGANVTTWEAMFAEYRIMDCKEGK